MSLTAPNLCLVPVDTIYEPFAAIPDEDASPGDFLFICPVENWGFRFTQLIEDNETSELAELESISVTSSNSEVHWSGEKREVYGKTGKRVEKPPFSRPFSRLWTQIPISHFFFFYTSFPAHFPSKIPSRNMCHLQSP